MHPGEGTCHPLPPEHWNRGISTVRVYSMKKMSQSYYMLCQCQGLVGCYYMTQVASCGLHLKHWSPI